MMSRTKKLIWSDIRDQVAEVDETFAELVDSLSPCSKYPLYLATYNYGDNVGDHQGTFLKNVNGIPYRLGDSHTPADILKHLNYGITNSPLMMIVDKTFEWYVNDLVNNVSFPIYVEKPGYFIGTRQLLTNKESITYLSSSIMSCTAGTRSAFMLPNIGNQKKHALLQRHLDLHNSAPKDMHQHSQVFKEISESSNSKWKGKLLIFSERWLQELKSNPKWIFLQKYLIEKLIKSWEHEKNSFFYNFAFSRAQLQQNIVSNPYLSETAKHIIGIALGAKLGFQPSANANSLPLFQLQQAYQETYKLAHTPVIMEPAKFDLANKNKSPIYYSLQRPIICSLDKQSKTETRALANLHQLRRMIDKFIKAFSTTNQFDYYQNTSLRNLADQACFNYYHHMPDKGIKKTQELITTDKRFTTKQSSDLKCSLDARFFRGCVKVSQH